jgi:hypothetical protein
MSRTGAPLSSLRKIRFCQIASKPSELSRSHSRSLFVLTKHLWFRLANACDVLPASLLQLDLNPRKDGLTFPASLLSVEPVKGTIELPFGMGIVTH